MPPRAKVTREQIVDGALSVVRKRGAGALTAKALSEELSCSTQPVFWQFESMEELKKEVYAAALAVFGVYLRRQDAARSAYLAIGMNYIRFATEERELFRLLFMSDFGQTDVVAARVEMEYILGVIGESGAVSDENAQTVYRDMWLFSHGIAAMMATGTANFTEAEAEKMLSDVYRGLVQNLEGKIKQNRRSER